MLEGSERDDKFFLAQARHFFVYLDHLGVLEDFVRKVRKTKDFSCKDLVDELTGMTMAELDADFKSKIKQWNKNEYVGSTFNTQGVGP